MSRIHRYLLEIHSRASILVENACRTSAFKIQADTAGDHLTPTIHRLIGFAHTIKSTPAIIGRMVILK